MRKACMIYIIAGALALLPTAARADSSDEASSRAAERAAFSGGRLLAEMGVAAVGGTLASYGTYRAICDSSDCIGGAIAGPTVNIVVTPLLTMGTGVLLGGKGSFYMTALFGLLGFSATAALSNQNPLLALSVSLALMPILAPLGYEISSNIASREMQPSAAPKLAQLHPLIAPLQHGTRVSGALAGVVGSF